GEVFALMLILYSIGRFMMELIRQDELGQFGTPFTISQLVSFGTILLGFGIFFGVRLLNPPNSKEPADQLVAN
ncbi:MAG: phosphatidylglycerol:prolipoprotein diacylglycerol transferase, partial [Mariniblastus sp.]